MPHETGVGSASSVAPVEVVGEVGEGLGVEADASAVATAQPPPLRSEADEDVATVVRSRSRTYGLDGEVWSETWPSGAVTWTQKKAAGAVLQAETYELGWTDGGRLNLKQFDPEPLTCTPRADRAGGAGSPAAGTDLETYTRDAVGNPTKVQVAAGGGLMTWNYAATIRYNQVPSRTMVGGPTDTFTYQSPSGRLATWTTSGGGPARTFAYDGAGGLRTATEERAAEAPQVSEVGP